MAYMCCTTLILSDVPFVGPRGPTGWPPRVDWDVTCDVFCDICGWLAPTAEPPANKPFELPYEFKMLIAALTWP